jgi:hypothetical protein
MNEVEEWLKAGHTQRAVDIYCDNGLFMAYAYAESENPNVNGYGEGPTMEKAMVEAVRCWARLQCGAV